MMFVAPVAVAAIIVFALGGTDDMGPAEIGWVVTDADASTEQFVAGVIEDAELAPFVTWRSLPDRAAAQQAVADEELGAVIIIAPPASPGAAPALEVVGDDNPIASGVAATIVDGFRVAHGANAIAAQEGIGPLTVAATALEFSSPGGASVDVSVHWGPAIGAFFLLLSMGYAAHRQVADRQQGVAGRVASTPVPPAATMIGRALAAATLGTASLVVMASSAQLLFGRAWGSWGQVLAVAAATAFAVAGIGTLLASLAKTPAQAQTFTAVASFGLAIGGGSFTPPSAASEPGAIARWFPTTLSLDGFSVITTTGHVPDLVVPVVALAATGLVLFFAATAVANRRSFA
jgi:hypothetical protein